MILCVVAILVLFTKGIYDNIVSQEAKSNQSTRKEDVTKITRAEVAKMISYLYFNSEEIEGLERVILYKDTDEKQWYDKYINGIYTTGVVEEVETIKKQYRPFDNLTYGECVDLLKRICMNQQEDSENTLTVFQKWIGELSFSLEEEEASGEITRLEWGEVYSLLVDVVKENEIKSQELLVLGIQDTIPELKQWQTVTDKGVYYFEGMEFEKYQDSQIKAYVKGDEILYIEQVSQPKVTLENVYLIEGKEKEIHVFINGYRRSFTLEKPLSEEINRVVGDLVVEKGQITKVNIKPEVINDRVLVTSKDYIELENYGKVSLSENYRIYRIYDELMMELTNGILVGYSTTDFVVADGKICAALITDEIKAKNIRVLLKTEGFQDIYHKTVEFKSDKDMILYYGKKEKKIPAGKEVTIHKNSKYIKNGRIRLETEGEEGKITVLSFRRNGNVPAYRGDIEIASNDGGLTIINELPLEEYLYGVIPSEMPTSYGLEALKVQAICARSYAYRQLMANSCGQYGAHVDDSVSYQVYNNIPENENSILAVKDTYGKVMEHQGDVITAYYFSTSCGSTASADQVWFSSEEVPYLIGKLQTKKEETGEEAGIDLSKEASFRKFITKNLYETYDSEFPWYRWKVKVSIEDLKKTIEKNLADRYSANPQLIQTLGENGDYESAPVKSIGTIEDISISKRQTCGVITELVIKGSQETIKVLSEYNIRALLAPLYENVVRQDKSKVEGMGMLPSAFFTLEATEKKGKLTGYSFTGGGYGHGVGMSQNGVKAMTEEGMTYEEILPYYYQGVKIGFIY